MLIKTKGSYMSLMKKPNINISKFPNMKEIISNCSPGRKAALLREAAKLLKQRAADLKDIAYYGGTPLDYGKKFVQYETGGAYVFQFTKDIIEEVRFVKDAIEYVFARNVKYIKIDVSRCRWAQWLRGWLMDNGLLDIKQ